MKKYTLLVLTSITLLSNTNLLSNQYKNIGNAEAKTVDIMAKSKKTSTKTNPSINKVKWYSFNEGIKKAKETKKYVFIDFYTDWCGYCTKLDNETYSNEKVYKYLNEKFISIKVDAESNKKIYFNGETTTEQDLAIDFGVNSYPYMFFMENEQNAITKIEGFLDSRDFYTAITYIGSNSFKTQNIDEYKKKNKM